MSVKRIAAAIAAIIMAGAVAGPAVAAASASGDVTVVCQGKGRILYAAPCRPGDKKIRLASGQQVVNTGGLRGPQGYPGKDGAPGERGETGPKGDRGETGERGPQGLKGDRGETGAKGDTGPKGDAGVDGKDATPLKYLTLDLSAFGIRGLSGTVTCEDVSDRLDVFRTGNCKKGSAPAWTGGNEPPAATPTPTVSPTPTVAPLS